MEFILGLAVSLHLGLNEKYNELHPFFQAKYDQFIAGAYYNSLSRTSLYVGYQTEFTEDLTLDLGVVTGYLENPDNIVPMARLKYKEWFVMPAAEGEEELGIVIGYEFKF